MLYFHLEVIKIRGFVEWLFIGNANYVVFIDVRVFCMGSGMQSLLAAFSSAIYSLGEEMWN